MYHIRNLRNTKKIVWKYLPKIGFFDKPIGSIAIIVSSQLYNNIRRNFFGEHVVRANLLASIEIIMRTFMDLFRNT